MDRQGDAHILTIVVLHADGLGLGTFVVSKIDVDEGRREGDERIDGANEVPATRVDAILVDRLGDRVVLDAVLNGLDCTDTH